MNNNELKIKDFGEKQLIDRIMSKASDINGDDAAVLKIDNGKEIIASSDMLLKSKHFPAKMSYKKMGFKAVTVNVSDLAAMGSKPLGFLLNIAVSKDFLIKNFDAIIEGVIEACNLYEIPLVGGDISESEEIIISGTALGCNEINNSLMKKGYKENDLICVTGELGLAALGLIILEKNFCHMPSTNKVLKPIARIKEGIIINEAGASSATDITDGLSSELYELFDNKHGIMIYEDKLNISDEFKMICELLDLDYFDLIFNVGEDFELLFTISKDNFEKIKDKIDVIVIGEINNSSKVEITLCNNKVEEISLSGYEHFK